MPEAPITENIKHDTTAGASSPAVKQSWPRIAIEFLILAPLAVLALEGFFTLLGVGEQNFIKPDTELGSVHIPAKIVTWRLEGFSRDTLSQKGWRDIERSVAKPAGTYRVALLGDSQTEALQVPLEKDFARLAEIQLNAKRKSNAEKFAGLNNIEVLNFGVSGYSTAQELLQLQKTVLTYQPDLVVVLYSRGDSDENTVDPAKRLTAEPRPFYYFDSNNKLTLDQSVLLANKEKLTSNPILEFLRANSRIYGVWDQTNFQLNLTDKFYNKTRRSLTNFIAKLTASYSPPASAPQYAIPDKLKVTQALLSEINTTARKHGADFLLITFPDMGNIDPIFRDQLPALRAQSAGEKFGMIELSQPFRDYKGNQALFYQVHFAEAGHQVAAQCLTDYVTSLLQKRSELQK